MADEDFDVAVIGAGAAGLAALSRLGELGLNARAFEARERVGGRAHTLIVEGVALDLGCGWLHSARQNAWTGVAERLGFVVDRSRPGWTRPPINAAPDEQRGFRAALAGLEARIEAAAEREPDAPVSSLYRPADARWRPRLDAFSGYYNGEAFDAISIHDYAAYQPTNDNWRLRRGYGALIEAFAAGLPISLSTPVRRLRHGPAGVTLVTDSAEFSARAAIVALPTSVIAEGGMTFDPPLPDKLEAAADLPLGHVDKAFLKLPAGARFEPDTRVQGRTDTAQTGGYTLRPMGEPIVEGYFGGALAQRLEAEGPGAFCAFAREELAAALGSDFADALEPLAESRWAADPFSRGAYSHARPGRAGARAILAAPVEGRIFFAGEACSPHAFSTAHGAYETGIAAATAAAAALQRG
ncbi:MAG TPA: NAD(P)/FAD-dependent oxidoreductase [Caulobacteraceae bacterium]|jgi:monoamine oxidase|nr:NAD(P)/FAD-dependent oxidoreductase [Caulobacteraceae bacterium]